jgi:hypothetical protein
MNYTIVSIDRDSLPTALLPAFKRWQRIDFSSDDILCTEILQGAIDQFERTSEITVFKSQIKLEPEAGDYACGSGEILRLPVTPINSIQLFYDDVPHSDETFLSDSTGYTAATIPLNGNDNYTLKTRGIHGVRMYHLVGAFMDGMSIAIDTGFTAVTPEIRQVLFAIAGHFYEYREIFLPSNINEPPMWLNQIMAGFWLPRV